MSSSVLSALGGGVRSFFALPRLLDDEAAAPRSFGLPSESESRVRADCLADRGRAASVLRPSPAKSEARRLVDWRCRRPPGSVRSAVLVAAARSGLGRDVTIGADSARLRSCGGERRLSPARTEVRTAEQGGVGLGVDDDELVEDS